MGSAKARYLANGYYVGDVTALCVLPLPLWQLPESSASSKTRKHVRDTFDTLLVGVGASIHWYNPLNTSDCAHPFVSPVRNVVRIHGITTVPGFEASCGLPVGRAVIVWGERRVTLVLLDVGSQQNSMRTVVTLPPLGNWVHDVRPLQPESTSKCPTIVLGLADNAVEQWALLTSDGDFLKVPRCIRRVECSLRSTVFSLALHGTSLADLVVAGGTIFNSVQLWAVGMGTSGPITGNFPVQEAEPWTVLCGHEGSVMRVSWAPDGAHVFSTSEDRTARMWTVPPRIKTQRSLHTRKLSTTSPTITFFGHTARVWDCQFVAVGYRSILATVGEDCTVRLWDVPEDTICWRSDNLPSESVLNERHLSHDKPLAILRGHKGRGAWRVVSMLSPGRICFLVTAAADASVRIWDLSEYLVPAEEKTLFSMSSRHDLDCSLEILNSPALPAVNSDAIKLRSSSNTSVGNVYLDGKHTPKTRRTNIFGNYVRVVCLGDPGTIFIASNRGVVHRAKVGNPVENNWRWHEIYHTRPAGPILSIELLNSIRDHNDSRAHRLALSDVHGYVIIILAKADLSTVETCWRASEPRKLLEVICSGPCIERTLLTSEVGGKVNIWKQQIDQKDSTRWKLTGVLCVPSHNRVIVVAQNPSSGLLLCGDQAGNLTAFDGDHRTVPMTTDGRCFSPWNGTLPLLAVLWRAHGADAVTVARVNCDRLLIDSAENGYSDKLRDVECITAGRDGCQRTFRLSPSKESRMLLGYRFFSDAQVLDFKLAEADLPNKPDFSTDLPRAQPSTLKTMKHAKRIIKAAVAEKEQESMKRSSSEATTSLMPYQFVCCAKLSFPGISTLAALKWRTGTGALFSFGNEILDLVAGFKGTDFVMYSQVNQCELLRVSCGGWHRPTSLLIEEPRPDHFSGFTFAFYKEGVITLCRKLASEFNSSDASKSSPMWNTRMLNMQHHGREVHAVCIIPPPLQAVISDLAPPLGVLTGSEDGTIIHSKYVNSTSGHAICCPVEVGIHACRAPVRAMSLIPECPGGGLDLGGHPDSYILLTAGAKNILMAWRVSWIKLSMTAAGRDTEANNRYEIRSSLISTRRLGRKGHHSPWNKGCSSGFFSFDSEQRLMAVKGFIPMDDGSKFAARPCSMALTASSNGTLMLLALVDFDLQKEGSAHWQKLAALHFHICPVLSVDSTSVALDAFNLESKIIACSGATDGTIALWDVTELQKTRAMVYDSSAENFNTTKLKPIFIQRWSHRFGVNKVSLARAPGHTPGRFFIASGGDDQALRVTLMSIRLPTEETGLRSDDIFVSEPTSPLSTIQTVVLDFAHSSAIRGLWFDGRVIVTTACDQRLRIWGVQADENSTEGDVDGPRFGVIPLAGTLVDCPEPESLDVCNLPGPGDGLCISVSGRGVQMFNFE